MNWLVSAEMQAEQGNERSVSAAARIFYLRKAKEKKSIRVVIRNG